MSPSRSSEADESPNLEKTTDARVNGHGNLTLTQRCGQLPSMSGSRADPLRDVIDWLDQAELGDDVVLGEAVSCRPQNSGAREIFADTALEGIASPTVRSRGMPVGIQQLPQTRLPQLKPANDALQTGPAGADGACCCAQPPPSPGDVRTFSTTEENEDIEWDMRQRQTGAAGRLVNYEIGDEPRADIHLRGGNGRRIVVTAVTEEGKADRAGVKAGDVLASINGKKEFCQHPADFVHASLVPPVTLVFMGFVGKLQAEVRLNYADQVAGMAIKDNFLENRKLGTMRILEEVNFSSSTTGPLFITTTSIPDHDHLHLMGHIDPASNFIRPEETGMASDCDEAVLDNVDAIMESGVKLDAQGDNGYDAEDICETLTKEISSTSSVYELRPADAKHVVRKALLHVQPKPRPVWKSQLSCPHVEIQEFPFVTDDAFQATVGGGTSPRVNVPRMATTAPSPFNVSPPSGRSPPCPARPSDPVTFVTSPAVLRGVDLPDDLDDNFTMSPVAASDSGDVASSADAIASELPQRQTPSPGASPHGLIKNVLVSDANPTSIGQPRLPQTIR